MFPVPRPRIPSPPDHILSHEPLNYFSIEPRGGNDRSRYRVPYLLDIFISDVASLYTGEMIYGLVDSWLDHRPTKVITVIEVVGVHLFFKKELLWTRCLECFWGRVGARRMNAWKWWIGERRTKLTRIIFENEKFFFIVGDRVNSNSNCIFLGISPFFLLRIRIAKCSSWSSNIFFFYFSVHKHPASRNVPFSQMYRDAKACLEKAREQFFVPKDRQLGEITVNSASEGED